MKPLILAASLALTAASCTTSSGAMQSARQETAGEKQAAFLPSVLIYKTSGNFTDNVPIQLNESRTAVVSYPAPSDITAESAPVKLADGYLLDRRGISSNTVFTTFTYSQYSRLTAAPTAEELMKAVIPGSQVTEIVEMPFNITQTDAASLCNTLIREGLPGCSVVYSAPFLKLD